MEKYAVRWAKTMKKENVYSNQFKNLILSRIKEKYLEKSIWKDENGKEWPQSKLKGYHVSTIDGELRKHNFEIDGRDVTFPACKTDTGEPLVFEDVIGHSKATFMRGSGIRQKLVYITKREVLVMSRRGKEYPVLIHANCIFDNSMEEIEDAIMNDETVWGYVTFISGSPELIQVEEIEEDTRSLIELKKEHDSLSYAQIRMRAKQKKLQEEEKELAELEEAY